MYTLFNGTEAMLFLPKHSKVLFKSVFIAAVGYSYGPFFM
jgi:hypothetical protein